MATMKLTRLGCRAAVGATLPHSLPLLPLRCTVRRHNDARHRLTTHDAALGCHLRSNFSSTSNASHNAVDTPSITDSSDPTTNFDELYADEDVDDDQYADDIRHKLFECAMKHVPMHGFTPQAIAVAAKELQYSPAVVALGEMGNYSLIHHFVEQCNSTMVDQCLSVPLQDMNVNERFFHIIKTRLSLYLPYISHWPHALATGGLPQHARYAVRDVAEIADDICHLAGDRSSDSSYYSRRAVVAGIYVCTELHMIHDRSNNYDETWRFLQRRLDGWAERAPVLDEMRDSVATYSTLASAILRDAYQQLTTTPAQQRTPATDSM